jgi:hypothetical protein
MTAEDIERFEKKRDLICIFIAISVGLGIYASLTALDNIKVDRPKPIILTAKMITFVAYWPTQQVGNEKIVSDLEIIPTWQVAKVHQDKTGAWYGNINGQMNMVLPATSFKNACDLCYDYYTKKAQQYEEMK